MRICSIASGPIFLPSSFSMLEVIAELEKNVYIFLTVLVDP